eukprot:1161845-Pelagomonas_calceolata.AAC.6
MQHVLSEYIELLPPSIQEVLEVLLRNPLYVSYATTLLSALTIGYILWQVRQIPFLDPKEFKPLKLVKKEYVNHNTLWMRFALSTKHQRLGLPIGQHMTFLAKDENGKDVYRSYTPVSDDQQRGSVDFVIKVYPQGKMSQVLNSLQVGQYIKVKGPKVRSSIFDCLTGAPRESGYDATNFTDQSCVVKHQAVSWTLLRSLKRSSGPPGVQAKHEKAHW